jgi:hypothetical protein
MFIDALLQTNAADTSPGERHTLKIPGANPIFRPTAADVRSKIHDSRFAIPWMMFLFLI